MLGSLTKSVWNDITYVIGYCRENGLRPTLSLIRSKEAPTTIQFAKYGMAGVATTIVHMGLFTLFSHTILPAHDYLLGGTLTDAVKEQNAILSNLLAFPFANIVAYGLNLWVVFTPGRHSRWREFLLFTAIAFFSFGAGLASGPFLISRGLNPWIAQGFLLVTSALVNFVCRKFLVFLR